jgi:hypothetical protein
MNKLHKIRFIFSFASLEEGFFQDIDNRNELELQVSCSSGI